MNTQDFLNQMKSKCEAKAKEMAKLELSIWDKTHESELKQYFGFNTKSLKQRKSELTKTSNS